MGFFDALFGRSKPKKPDLDQLFGIPSAAITLEVATEFRPTGVGSVAFRAAEGAAFSRTQQELEELLLLDNGVRPRVTLDEHGYTWITVTEDPLQISELVTDLHAINSGLEAQGFGPYLLCSLINFTNPSGRKFALVYLYKRGSFYPFAPISKNKRDTALELQLNGVLANDIKLEKDLTRWFPVWGAPGLA